MLLEPGSTVDRYTIEQAIGEGGMAVVYKARHARLGSLHAIKVLKLPVSAVRERLEQEGRAQAQLRHPNIVAVTDMVEVDGSPGLVMEYIDGASLDELLARTDLTLDQLDQLTTGILSGVTAAHDAGLIHRDLKPGNILLELHDQVVRPKVTDFGLAKLLDTGSALGGTRSGMSMGTPSYMAPEQIESAKDVDRRADIFSLGVLLYEMVCGVRPFQGGSTLAILNAVATGQRASVLDHAPDTPERIVRAIDAALQIEPEARPADCASLLDLWMGDADGIERSGVWDDALVRVLSASRHRPPPSSSLSRTLSDLSAASELPAVSKGPSTNRVPSTLAPPPIEPTRRWLAGALVAGAVGGLTLAFVLSRPPPPSPSPRPDPMGLVSVEPMTLPPVSTPQPAADPAPPPRPAPVVPRPPPDPARPPIRFDSVPAGAEVLLDGLRIGRTPIRGFEVPRGRHRLTMRLGDRETSTRIHVSRRSTRAYTWTAADDVWSEE